MVDQPFGQRWRQQQVALGHGDEDVAQPVEPELRAAHLADAGVVPVKLLDMARLAGHRREHPAANVSRHGVAVGPPTYQDDAQLARDGQLQRYPGLGLLDPEQTRLEVHPLPAK